VGRVGAFLEVPRRLPSPRPARLRVLDWKPFEPGLSDGDARQQAARCMDCGVPFCHSGCPLGNRIPEWNEAAHRGDWKRALQLLHATNNFPEFTGRICPAPCEASCVLAPTSAPVAIEALERAIVERGWSEGWITPLPAPPNGRRVAVVGSGPAGLAAAQQLARRGHTVTVFEKDDRPGGLLRYGIPDFKLDRALVDRRLEQLRGERIAFRCGVALGRDVSLAELQAGHDAVVLAVGAGRARDLPLPGRERAGVHLAMDYLVGANRVVAGDRAAPPIDAAGLNVVVLGGGDTGADCVGTAHRQGAASVTQIDVAPAPPEHRLADNPWPELPRTRRDSSSHAEGGERRWDLRTERFEGDERVRGVLGRTGSGVPFGLPAQLVLIAAGFVGIDRDAATHLGVRSLLSSPTYERAPGVFACGDARLGPSLVVSAIAEGRACAAAVDASLG
jgi:glutamate synthase (NADPH/NADH) small chain